MAPNWYRVLCSPCSYFSYSKLKGFLLVIISAITYGLYNIFLKAGYSTVPVIQVQVIIRTLTMIIVLIPGIPSENWEWKRAMPAILSMLICSIAWSYAIYFTKPGDCIAITSATVPLVTAVFGYLFFRKPFPSLGIIPAALGTIIGCMLLIEPSFLFANSPTTMNDTIGYGLTFGDAFFYSTYILFTAVLKIDPQFLTFATASARVCFWLIPLALSGKWTPISYTAWLKLLACAFFLTIGSVSRNAGTPLAGPVATAFLILFETPWIYFCESLFLNLHSTYLQYTGVAVTLTTIFFYMYYCERDKEKVDKYEKPEEEEV